jgi:DnaJ-class molecular chaperone
MAKKQEVTCPQCLGKGKKKYYVSGKKREDTCGYCAGTGKVDKWD